jgi:capsular exopolysaccharide synthesis family protein
MAASDEKKAGGEVDLVRWLRVLSERRWALVAAVAGGMALFVLWASRQHKVYEATATIIVDVQPPQVLGSEVRDVVQVGPGAGYLMSDYIQTQRRVLMSDSLSRRTIARLHLTGDAEFWGVPPASPNEGVERFGGAVRVEPILDTQIIAVSFQHADPRQAKRAVDGLVDAYIEANLEFRDTSNMTASKWLAGEEDDLRKRLGESELSLYEFKRRNDLLTLSLEDRVNNTSRDIEKLSEALTETRLRKLARLSEVDELNRMASDQTLAVVPAGGDTLSELKRELTDEERRLSELKERYEDAHPLVRQQAAKLGTVRAAIKREVALQIRGAQARANEAAEQEKKIGAQLETAKQEALRVARLEVEYNKAKREADALAKQYLVITNRTKETELASKTKSNNLRVLDYARIPGAPIRPQLTRAGMLAAFLSLFAGVLLAFGLDAVDRSVKTQADVDAKLGLPYLGTLPHLAAGYTVRAVADQPASAIAESCRLIRTNLMFAGLTRPLRRLLVTSPVAKDGKTLTAASLGIVLAQAGQKVLLVDADLRQPGLSKQFGVRAQIGLTDVLLGTADLSQAIVSTNIPNLSILCAGASPPNPAELLDGSAFADLIDKCAQGFERVVLDSPPAVPVADPGILARHCDGVVLVLRARRTRFDFAQRASRHLQDVGARMIGVVLNDSTLRHADYGEYYHYGSDGGSKQLARRA